MQKIKYNFISLIHFDNFLIIFECKLYLVFLLSLNLVIINPPILIFQE